MCPSKVARKKIDTLQSASCCMNTNKKGTLRIRQFESVGSATLGLHVLRSEDIVISHV